jgi:hypothetical protein
VSDDIFDRALDRRNALIKEQRRRIKALEEALRGLASASTERIGALEEALREVIEDYDWVQGGPGDRDWNVLDNTIIRARNLLKEADQ